MTLLLATSLAATCVHVAHTYVRKHRAHELFEHLMKRQHHPSGFAQIASLIRQEPELARRDDAVRWAARYGDPRLLEYIIRSGADLIKWRGYDDESLLAIAVEYENFGNVRFLLEYGGNPNETVTASGSYGWQKRPLIAIAANYGDYASSSHLLHFGADANKPCPDGTTALHFATGGIHLEVTELLLKHGADAHLQDDHGLSAIDYVARSRGRWRGFDGCNCERNRRRRAIVRALCNAGAELDFPTAVLTGDITYLRSALHEDPRLAEQSVMVGLDSSRELPALQAAVVSDEFNVVMELLRAGVDVNRRSKDGGTALMRATWANQRVISRALLEAGADPLILDRRGKSAMDFALGLPAPVTVILRAYVK